MSTNAVSEDVNSSMRDPGCGPVLDLTIAGCAAFIESYISLYPGWRADFEESEYTTWNSVILVLFAAAYMQNRSPKVLSRATGFPEAFIACVVRVTNHEDFWESDYFGDLFRTVRDKRHDVVEVNHSLEYLQENVLRRLTEQLSAWLHTARAGTLFGGAHETVDQYAEQEQAPDDQIRLT